VPLEDVLATAGAVLVVAAVVVEAVWLAHRRGVRRLAEHPTAVVMALGSLVVAPWFLGAYDAAWDVLGPLAPVRVRHPLAQAVAAFVAWDLAGYAHHRLGHRTRIGWASHQAHHSGSDWDLSLALRQSWLPLPALVTFPLVALAGVPLPAALGSAAVSNLWQALTHSAAPVSPPAWLAAVVVTPASHQVHHLASGRAVNLGPVLTVWDRLAGTWQAPPQRVPAVLPRRGDGRRAGPVAIELRGWRRLALGASR
jgi:sterol desaturase/sphingolipid hydroxylase (fatty acid hydroxylase superfamily)